MIVPVGHLSSREEGVRPRHKGKNHNLKVSTLIGTNYDQKLLKAIRLAQFMTEPPHIPRVGQKQRQMSAQNRLDIR